MKKYSECAFCVLRGCCHKKGLDRAYCLIRLLIWEARHEHLR